MIETGNFSDFNLVRRRKLTECEDIELRRILLEKADCFPLIRCLLTETTRFYTEYFSELQNHIVREKRLVVFETPSRVQMTHEYTIEDIGQLKNGFYFLFNATERLSWLKIQMEDNRVSIASKKKVIIYLKNKLGRELEELSNLLKTDVDETAYRLYEASDGKPCFVEFNQKENKGQQSILLSVTFFDSIQNKTGNKYVSWKSPLQEKRISYRYNTLSNNASAWIYFKAPSNFVLSARHKGVPGHYVESSPSNDEEITSLVLKPNGEALSVAFDIFVNVPTALKWWYNGILYLSYTIALICLVAFVASLVITLPAEFTNTLSNSVYTVVAALIATRGWLMSEEQVMKKISNYYTVLVWFLLVLVIAISITCHVGHDEKKNLTNIIPPSDIYPSCNNTFNEKGNVNNMTSCPQWQQMSNHNVSDIGDSMLFIDHDVQSKYPLSIREIH